jgi:hypothetical protein
MDLLLQNLIRQWRADPSDANLAQKIAAAVSRSGIAESQDDDAKYALTLTEKQARVLIDSTDLYSRTLIGQVDEFLEPMRRQRRDVDYNNIHDAQDIINQQVKPLLYPGMPPNASHGIGSDQVPESAKIAFDLHQVIRHRVTWDGEKPNNEDLRVFRGVWHDAPRKVSTEQPLAKIEGEHRCNCRRSDCQTGW